ncbi:MAG: PHP domain-containing protein, partial [Planctomycetota bacterium]
MPSSDAVAGTPPFVHLNVHSAFSLLSGASTPEVLIARAGVEGHTALALTDTDGAYALPLFQACCDAAGLHAIHGAEIHDPLSRQRKGAGADENARAVVLAKDARGYRSLCRLLTRRQLGDDFRLSSDLVDEGEGLVVLTPSPRLLGALHPHFPEGDLYGEGVAHAPAKHRRVLWEEATTMGRPLAGTFRAFFARRKDHALHRLLLAIRHLKFLRDVTPGAEGRDDLPLDLSPPTAWLQPPPAAAKAFRDTPQAAPATVEIARRCTFRLERPARPRLPLLEIEERPTDDGTAYGRLAALCMKGVERRYGHIRPDVLARLERELRVIQDRGFCDYFLIVHGLARFARERGIPVVGRGSAANSMVAYALSITSVDPLRYDLPFERFLSPARKDCPDIDLDIDWRGRDTVIEHAYDTYGDERVAMICTHVTFQARGAVREAAKTMGIAPPEVDRVVKHLPWRLASLTNAKAPPPELDGIRLDRPPWRTVFRAAQALDGLPRHLSIHAGGIVVGDGPLADSVPLERSAKGLVVTQYDMHGVEATGLVKIDLLGNRALAVISDVVREAKATYGETVDLDRIPEDDDRAGGLLS